MRWKFSPRERTSARWLSLVVEAKTWYDAREQAFIEFQSTNLAHKPTSKPAHVVVRWQGTDAGSRQERRKLVEWVR